MLSSICQVERSRPRLCTTRSPTTIIGCTTGWWKRFAWLASISPAVDAAVGWVGGGARGRGGKGEERHFLHCCFAAWRRWRVERE